MIKSIEELIKNNILKLISINVNKKLESENVIKLYEKKKENIIIKKIIFNEKNNTNKKILKLYDKKPDIIIIVFNKNNKIYKIDSIPVYPIIYEENIYLTPILLEQLNGFSNVLSKKTFLLNDFYNRIYYNLGALITDDTFIINISDYEYNGLNDYRLYKDHFVTNINNWMTIHIPKNNFGWFGIRNQLAIDYVFENYNIKNVAELGIYFGKSTQYISNKNKNTNYYCFDRFDNIFLSDYITEKLTPEDTNFFYKFMRFETFHSNIYDHKKLYSIKNNNFLAIQWLKDNKIDIDFFYIDFIKDDVKLIDFINEIFEAYPNCIIIGDDLVHLTYSIDYLSKKYNIIRMFSCYLCSKNNFINKKKIIHDLSILDKKTEETDISKIKNYDMHYKFIFISKNIDNKKNYNDIIKYIDIINVNPNNLVDRNNNNLFHYIIKNRKKDEKYYLHLYNILDKKYKDENLINFANITPIEYKEFINYFTL
jgi:hypothetical protein